jgi:hypothetical protein
VRPFGVAELGVGAYKIMKYLLALTVICLISHLAQASPLSDKQLSQLVVGNWKTDSSNSDVTVEEVISYKNNNSFSCVYTIRDSSGKKSILTTNGIWSVHNGIFSETVTNSSSERMRPGLAFHRSFDSIDEKTMILRSESGNVTATFTHLPDKKPQQGAAANP